jgi:MFS family permease
LIPSLFPLKIADDYNVIGSLLVGIFLSIEKVGFVASSGIVGKIQASIGRKNSVMTGMVLTGLACAIYGFAAFATNPYVFYGVSFVGRVINGIADGFMKVGIYAILNLEFTVDSEKYSGIVQGSQGLGTLIGPFIMAVTLPYIDYMGTFYVFGAIILLSAFTICSSLPSRLNTKEGVDNKAPSLTKDGED